MISSKDFDVQSELIEVTVKGMHGVVLPDAAVDPFVKAGHSRVRVTAVYEGRKIEFHAALKKYQGEYVITFSKAKQKELGVFPNDYFQMKLEEDTSRYGVDVPEELDAVLYSDPDALAIFEELTDGRKRSLIYMIARFKTAENRIEKSIRLSENLKRGIRDPKDLLKSF